MKVGNIVNKTNRPVNLDLQTMRFPVTAIASILHRVSGVITFFALAVLLSLLARSLSSADGFMAVQQWLDSFVVKFCLWLILSVFIYHVVFGIRHMIMDLGYWEELIPAAISSRIGFVIVIVCAIMVGGLVW
ncbi:succinate dehydrogenase, cytochrome b556 subunit [Celerinatantimonas sp. YJH-8]|uniref:succinate dehydrogenase, cytochrome b556 subunit n=1 Tax=Celerinatantimonas sp. YJH-8 TaxID=3228714 RepID=UPI0038CA9031